MPPKPFDQPLPQTLKKYVCFRAPTGIEINGDLSKTAWQAAPWTDEFVDIEGDVRPRPRHRTRAKMMWDDEFFYVAAEMDEPHLWGTLTQHDSIVYHDNDFEVFLNPTGDNHCYYELEINALGTVFDLWLLKPYRDGGPADHDWNVVGLRKAVRLEGSLNNPRDVDRGWAVELAFPWRSFDRHVPHAGPAAQRRSGSNTAAASFSPGTMPKAGDQWRVNFSRVQWDLEVNDGAYRKIAGRPEHNWVWSAQGIIDMHRPEMWGIVQFSGSTAGSVAAERERITDDGTGVARAVLHAVYYAQARHRAERGAWAGDLGTLVHAGWLSVSVSANATLETTDDGWRAHTPVAGRLVWIQHDSLVWVE